MTTPRRATFAHATLPIPVRTPVRALLLLAAGITALAAASTAVAQGPRPAGARGPACERDNAGLVLPADVCALTVASDLGAVRQLAVAPNGDLYAALSAGSAVTGHEDVTGGVLAFRDRDGDGVPDERARFGPGAGNDVKWRAGYLYFARNDQILRWRLTPGKLAPEGKPEPIVGHLPADGGHMAKSLAFGGGDTMYVNIGSGTNSCQETDRKPASPGKRPCPELAQRAGIWIFSADRSGQTMADGRRFAGGVRNAMALAVEPVSRRLVGVVNGRDQLGDNWGYSPERNAENPAEELIVPRAGEDYGWPYCYYDVARRRRLLAPEYGGDGTSAGECAHRALPAFVFPAHWAPMAIAFAGEAALAPAYRHGAFVAFRGSWNRAPLPQAGYQVAFVTFAHGRPTGYRTFATGAEGPTSLRATGVAVAPDGSLYISADRSGKIWHIIRKTIP